jgi:hypothetical protein
MFFSMEIHTNTTSNSQFGPYPGELTPKEKKIQREFIDKLNAFEQNPTKEGAIQLGHFIEVHHKTLESIAAKNPNPKPLPDPYPFNPFKTCYQGALRTLHNWETKLHADPHNTTGLFEFLNDLGKCVEYPPR